MNIIKPVKTRKAIATVAILAQEIWQQHYTPLIGPQQVAYMLDGFQSVSAIVRQIQEGAMYYLVGTCLLGDFGYFCVYVREKKKELFVSKLYIKADERGKGFGRQVLEFIETLAWNYHCPSITLMVNKKNAHAIAVYKKCGFKVESPVVTDIGGGFVMDDYEMRKPLLLEER
ncbi:MAG TPA: GNAT family N-acetyltransferase [Candidatus Omnitrophota bacterium]|nr:GNAT family N-acetyltransferase [Candidatus Omnitrophota bacterium]